MSEKLGLFMSSPKRYLLTVPDNDRQVENCLWSRVLWWDDDKIPERVLEIMAVMNLLEDNDWGPYGKIDTMIGNPVYVLVPEIADELIKAEAARLVAEDEVFVEELP
jgi:hypothetical protein